MVVFPVTRVISSTEIVHWTGRRRGAFTHNSKQLRFCLITVLMSTLKIRGEVPLHLAASPFRLNHEGQLAIMQLLLDSGADTNARDNAGSDRPRCTTCQRCTGRKKRPSRQPVQPSRRCAPAARIWCERGCQGYRRYDTHTTSVGAWRDELTRFVRAWCYGMKSSITGFFTRTRT